MTARHHGARVASLFRGARRTLAAGLAAWALVLGAAGTPAADHFVITPEEANMRTETGELMLIDVKWAPS